MSGFEVIFCHLSKKKRSLPANLLTSMVSVCNEIVLRVGPFVVSSPSLDDEPGAVCLNEPVGVYN